MGRDKYFPPIPHTIGVRKSFVDVLDRIHAFNINSQTVRDSSGDLLVNCRDIILTFPIEKSPEQKAGERQTPIDQL